MKPAIPIIDGHNDSLRRCLRHGDSAAAHFLERTGEGHIDLPRALEGGLRGGFFRGDGAGVVGITFYPAYVRADKRADPHTPIGEIAAHVRAAVDRIGVDHVALGSDFDAAENPAAIGDVTGYPRVIEALRDAGFADDELSRIAHGNWLRVLRQTWDGCMGMQSHSG